ncbi:unnamed protein product [Peniophora sp. CBMAI 1063]|nr:unnamed protein product [Peniophora sp. CBMAI 1063]
MNKVPGKGSWSQLALDFFSEPVLEAQTADNEIDLVQGFVSWEKLSSFLNTTFAATFPKDSGQACRCFGSSGETDFQWPNVPQHPMRIFENRLFQLLHAEVQSFVKKHPRAADAGPHIKCAIVAL